MVKKEYKDLSKKEKIIGWTVLAFIAIVVIAAVSGGSAEKENSENVETNLIQGTNISKDAVENACTDAKYGINDEYDPIDALNYEFNSYDYAYDKDGNSIILSEWNGKKKDSDESVKFQCYVSGADDDSISVIYIRAGGKDIWKSMNDLYYHSYDKDGKPQYPDLHDSSDASNSTFHGVEISLSKVDNDVTGKWRVAVISEPIAIADYGVEYYKKYINGKDEIHAIVNKNNNTTTKIGKIGPLTISVYESVKGEESDAKKMFSGKLLSEKFYDSETGEEITF